jgi:hypothetical protein
MTSGFHVTNSFLASANIALACIEYNVPFQALLSAWHRMVALCKKSLDKVKDKDIVTKFHTVAKTVASQGQKYVSKHGNFIYNLYMHGTFNCSSGSQMLYAIFEALEPDILDNVYFIVVPGHIFLLLKDRNKWIVFETTYYDDDDIDINDHKIYLKVEDIIAKSQSMSIEKEFNYYGFLIFKSPYLVSIGIIKRYIKNNKYTRQSIQKIASLFNHMTFCNEGVIQKYFCLKIFQYDDKNKDITNTVIFRKRMEKLEKKVIFQVLDDLPFKNYFFRDKNTIKLFKNRLYTCTDIRKTDKIAEDYIKERNIKIEFESKHTKFLEN